MSSVHPDDEQIVSVFDSGWPMGDPVPFHNLLSDDAVSVVLSAGRGSQSLAEWDVSSVRDVVGDRFEDSVDEAELDRISCGVSDRTGDDDDDREFGINDPTKSRISESFSG